MNAQDPTLRAFSKWLEMSRAGSEAPTAPLARETAEVMQRTETLLALSRSIRSISAQSREFAESTRAQARKARDSVFVS